MALFTPIEWATHTVNFWLGCTPQSAECSDCYSLKMGKRTGHMAFWGKGRTRYVTKGGAAELRRANALAPANGLRPIVFLNSMSDFFDIDADPDVRRRAWDVIRECDRVRIAILTKQAQNIAAMLPEDWGDGWAHVWLGISAGMQATLDEQAAHLFSVPAAKYIWSAEPMMEEVDATRWLSPERDRRFDWVMIGGQSATHHLTHLEHLGRTTAQALAAGVPTFVKQLGTNPVFEGQPWPVKNRKGGDVTDFPEWLRHQQFPEGAAAMPRRVQRRRVKGWRMPANTVSVTRPGKWGNSFKAGAAAEDPDTGETVMVENAETAVDMHRRWLLKRPDLVAEVKRELGGFSLACSCAMGAPCHADTLLAVANGVKGGK